MTIITAKEIWCDECSNWLRIDLSIRHDWPNLKKTGWSRKNGKHYCPACTAKRKQKESE